MTEHHVLVGYRLRVFALADELGNVSHAGRLMGVHGSTYYWCKPRSTGGALKRYGSGSAAGRGCPTKSAASGAADRRLQPRPSLVRSAADRGRAGAREVGRAADLRTRDLAGAPPGRAEHARPVAGR
jgi:hypothetical protein